MEELIKMKFLFLVNSAPYISEFLGSLSNALMARKHEVVLYLNSEYAKKYYLNYYEKKSKIYERNIMKMNKDSVDSNFTWKNFFETWDRHKNSNFFNEYSYSSINIEKTYSDISYLIEKEKPDFIISEPPANVLTEIAYFLSQKYNIKYLGFIQSRFPQRIDIYDKKYTNSLLINPALSEIRLDNEEKETFLKFNEDFIEHKIVPDYLKATVNNIHNISLLTYYLKKSKKIKEYYDLHKLIKRKNYYYDYETLISLKLLGVKNNFLRKLRKNNYNKYIDSIKNLKNNNYFIFPLHLQPEASTSGQATYFSDLLSTIKYLAFALPYPYLLAVKEHPSALGTRTNKFYEELKKIPNVVLLGPYENNKKLIENSKGVITLTSTLGLEAALIGKLVLVLGEVFYQYHPNCVKVDSFKDIPDIINSASTISEKLELDNINSKFWKMYQTISIPGSFYEPLTEISVEAFIKFLERIKQEGKEEVK